jgi:hypothetical protein
MSTNDPASVKRGRRQLLALAALFFVPLALAFWMYYGSGAWRPGGDVSKGDLIDPARPLPQLSVPTMQGAATRADFLLGKWTMLYVGDGLCDERCRKALYLMRQSRIALNKDMDRVQRVFLVTSRCCDREFLSTPPRRNCSRRSPPTTACPWPLRAGSTSSIPSGTCS